MYTCFASIALNIDSSRRFKVLIIVFLEAYVPLPCDWNPFHDRSILCRWCSDSKEWACCSSLWKVHVSIRWHQFRRRGGIQWSLCSRYRYIQSQNDHSLLRVYSRSPLFSPFYSDKVPWAAKLYSTIQKWRNFCGNISWLLCLWTLITK